MRLGGYVLFMKATNRDLRTMIPNAVTLTHRGPSDSVLNVDVIQLHSLLLPLMPFHLPPSLSLSHSLLAFIHGLIYSLSFLRFYSSILKLFMYFNFSSI